MTEPEHVIPWDRLPRGFAERIDAPPEPPAEPRPAATIVLLRDAHGGPEVLLLRRHARSGFVPGAWVFPGGRTDPGDALDGYWPAGATRPEHPPLPFWIAAVREVFEETGVLLAQEDHDIDPERLAHWRERLLADQATLLDLLKDLGLRVALDDVIHIAHWITPQIEPRRYDTHFFLAALPSGRPVAPDAREITDALWLSPRDALDRHAAHDLPMVFPTVRTLEELAAFDSTAQTIDTLRRRPVPTIMPRLVRTPEGVGFLIEREGRT